MSDQAIQKIKTLIRVRPLLPFEDEPAWAVQTNQIQCLHTKSAINKIDKDGRRSKYDIQNCFKQLTMHFDSIVSQKVSSQKLYKQQIRGQLQQCLTNNKNMTLMCYGQTCSGKTYTILGQQKSPGLMPCLLRQLMIFTFNKQNKLTFSIELSYFQLYNENIYDLLNENHKHQPKGKQVKLKLYEDKIYGWEVDGIKKEKVQTFQQCVKIIQKGQKNRSYRSKQNHQRSSRSHTLMRIYIQTWDNNFTKKQQHINIVDLAGSERLSTLGSNINHAQTASINKSLFQLSNVISKLSIQQQNAHIPYRDSKLTKLLQKSLSSIENKCLIIFCISPSINCFNQSISTLRLAQKAKKVIVKPSLPDISHIENKFQKQLLKTKRKLRQKEQQCQFLNQKLDMLLKQVKQLQNKIKQDQTFTAKANLIVLLDHQNFTIQNLMNDMSFKDDLSLNQTKLNSKLKDIKQSFLKNIQNLYEQYSTNVIHQYIRANSNFIIGQSQDILIKLEQICFMNIVYEPSRIIQHKIEVIQNILKDLQKPEEQKQQNNENIQFIIRQYLKRLKSQNKPKQSKFNNFKDSNKLNQLSYQIEKIHEQRKAQNELRSNQQQQNAVVSQLYSWGCLKDNRVCKGKSMLTGIILASLPQDLKISSVACGFNHTLFVNQRGEIYGWGKNNQHQISSKKQHSFSIPKKISFHQKIKSISAGWSHSMCLTQDGVVYSWGCGRDGQLGHGINQNQQKPRKIQFKNKIIKIYSGHSNSAIISEDYLIYFFGFNKDFRCLNSQSKVLNTPTKIPIPNVKRASLGTSHSAILTFDNQLFCGGVGTNNQLGCQINLNTIGAEYIQTESKQYQESEKFQKIIPLIQVEYTQTLLNTQKIIDVKCGQNSTFLLTNYENLYHFGKWIGNQEASFKFRKIVDQVQRFSIGSRHGFAIKTNKKIYGWGFNMYNQLGNGKQKDIIVPEEIGSLNSLKIQRIQCGFIHSVGLSN